MSLPKPSAKAWLRLTLAVRVAVAVGMVRDVRFRQETRGRRGRAFATKRAMAAFKNADLFLRRDRALLALLLAADPKLAAALAKESTR